MPRKTPSTHFPTLSASTSAMPSIVEAVVLVSADTLTTYRYATQTLSSFRGSPYTARLRKISALSSTLNQGLQRLTATLTNADLDEAQRVSSPAASSYLGWRLYVYKILTSEDGLTEGYAIPFDGIVVGFRQDENVLELDCVTRVNRAPTLSNRRVSVKCPWEFKSTECGYVGVETVCNKLYDDAGGCSGRSNQFRFGGFPSRPVEAAIKAITDKGKPPAYQLVQLDTTYQSQRTTLRFDDSFSVADDAGTNATVITSLGSGGGTETPDWIDVTSSTYKASGSATTTTGDITNATPTLTVASATSFAIGQGIRVAGAGVASADLVTTISNIAGTTFTLADNASTTVVGAVVSHDDTAAIQAAIDAAVTAGQPVYIPAGNYRVSGLLKANACPTIYGDGPAYTTLTSATNAAILEIQAAASTINSFIIEGVAFYGYGSGASNYGLYLNDSGGNGFFNVTLRDLRFNNCYANALKTNYGGNATFTCLLEGIDVSQPSGGGDAIDLWGSNDTTLMRCYVHSVATGKAAYRIRSGSPTLIGCNGIDSGTTASWGVFGNKTSEDGTDTYCRVTLIGCNVESFTDYGVRCKDGSFASFIGTQLIAPATGTVTPIKFDYVTDNQAGIFDALSGVQTLGATYTNGYAVHSDGLPFMQVGHREFTSYYDTAGAAAATFPAITGTRITGTQDYATTLNGYTKIAGHVSMNEQSAPGAAPSNTGFLYAKDDGGATALYWKSDGVTERRIDTPSTIGLTATRIAFGDGSNLLTSSANLTWDDLGKSLTVSKAGGHPAIFIEDTDATITVRIGTLSGAPDRGLIGTMTNDPFVLYQNGTEAWGLDTSRHFRPYEFNDGQDIGVSAAKVRTGYFGTSIELGSSAVKAGEIVLHNASTGNALKLKAGATSAATTLTLPTDDGTSGQFLKTDGSGVLSWDTPASGANTALSNLASVAVNTSILPGVDNTHDLGSATYSWRDAHIERDALIGRQIQSSGSALSYAAGTGAGTTPTITIDGNAIAGAILLTTGTTPATSSQIVQVTMAASFTTYPVVMLTPGNAAAAALTGNKQVFVDDAAMLTNKWTLKSGSTALDAATDYVWYFHVIGI